jgi:hypothetical protein
LGDAVILYTSDQNTVSLPIITARQQRRHVAHGSCSSILTVCDHVW